MKDVVENALKNRVFLETSIWKGFGEGVGRVLGGNKSRFSRFFPCFSKQKSKCVLEAKKLRKCEKNVTLAEFRIGLAECAASRGEKKRGVRSLKM